MGAYLDQPKTEKESSQGEAIETLGLVYSSCSMQGWRRTMEDAVAVDACLPQGEAIFGVFDGHGGKEIALFCSREIVKVFTSLESYSRKDYELALRECFIALDASLSSPDGQAKIIEIAK